MTELHQQLKQLDAKRSRIERRLEYCKLRQGMHHVKDHAVSLGLHIKLTHLPPSMTLLEALENVCAATDDKYAKTFGYFDEDRDESFTEGYDNEHLTDNPPSRPDSEGDSLDDRRGYCDDQQSINSGPPTAHDGGRGDTG